MEFNDLDPIGPEEEPSHRTFRRQRQRRGVHILPGFFTVANLLCGYYAVLATLEGAPSDLDNAARAIGIAILFDSLDGRVARAMGTTSEFGKQFDSLADVISFGIPPLSSPMFGASAPWRPGMLLRRFIWFSLAGWLGFSS